MNKKILVPALLTLTLLTACQAPKTEENTSTSETESTQESSTPPIETNQPESPTSALNSPLAKIGDIEYSEPKVIEPETILKDKIYEKLKTLGPKDISPESYMESLNWTFYFYEAGKIKIDPYKDWSLVVLSKFCDGPCPATIYRFAWDQQSGKIVNLENYSYNPTKEDYDYMDDEMKFLLEEIDSKTVFKSLELPKTISIPSSSEVLELAAWGKDVDLAEKQYPGYEEKTIFEFGKVALTDPVLGNIYMEASSQISCLYALLPDGTIQRYAYNPKFFDKNPNGNSATLADGSGKLNLKKDFHYFEVGCGITGGCYFSLNDVNEDNLKLVATSGNGIKLYSVKEVMVDAIDAETARINNLVKSSDENVVIYQLYQTYGAINNKADYQNKEKLQEFADMNQVLFWKDPFGRYSYIAHNEIASMVECGKPVIYLYPEKEMDVNVSVGIDRITKSVPEHGKNGWSVRANPDGKIYNYADKQEYPYLFWEGTDEEQIEVNEGFVIARKNVPAFLDDSLAKLGLNKTEKADFMDFWESRILENTQPYFYFSFLGTRDFNKIAPLAISPKPDTLIRVFMYYRPLNTAMKVRPQTLRSIPRKGFTVIEWGGTSSIDFTQ